MKLNKKSINSIFHSVGESQNSYAAHAKRGHRAGASDECATPFFLNREGKLSQKATFRSRFARSVSEISNHEELSKANFQTTFDEIVTIVHEEIVTIMVQWFCCS